MLKPFVTALIGDSIRNIIPDQMNNDDTLCNQPKLALVRDEQLLRARSVCAPSSPHLVLAAAASSARGWRCMEVARN